MNERVKNLNMIKTLKIETPWTTGSSDEGSNNYLYYKIQQAKKSKISDSKYERIFQYLDSMKVNQIDFHGMLNENIYKKRQQCVVQKGSNYVIRKPNIFKTF